MDDFGATRIGWLEDTVEQLRSTAPREVAVEDHLHIAGNDVVIRYAEPQLAEILSRANRHLRAVHGDAPPALTIDCWIGSDPGVVLPGPASADGTAYVDDGTAALTWEQGDGRLFAYDRSTRRAWARFDSLAVRSTWETAAPFRRILHWWATSRGLQLVHGAAVGTVNGGLLLVGRGGSGKSTTALACLDAGLSFLGDDACLLDGDDPPWVHGLYVSAKGDAHTDSLLPGFRNEFARSRLKVDGETVLFADGCRPERIATAFPARGIIVLRLTGEPASRISPIGAAAALRAIAPNTVLPMPGHRADGLARLSAIVRRLPAWELTLGPNPASSAALIGQLLDELNHA